MNYGIFRKADLSDTKSRLVAFVDFGYSKTSVFVAEIKKNSAKIVLEKNNRNLGIRNMDKITLEYYINLFKEKYKEDLRENPKSIYRLFEALEKQRKVLSAD